MSGDKEAVWDNDSSLSKDVEWNDSNIIGPLEIGLVQGEADGIKL